MCDKVVSTESFLLKYSPDRHKTQKICDFVDSFILALKFIPDWFVTSKRIGNSIILNFNDIDIIFDDIDSDIVKLFSSDIVLNSIKINNDNNFDDCNPKIINHVRLLAWYNRYSQYKACQKRQIKN